MPGSLSPEATAIRASVFNAYAPLIAEVEAAGQTVIALQLGDTVRPPPVAFAASADLRYGAPQGLTALKDAIGAFLARAGAGGGGLRSGAAPAHRRRRDPRAALRGARGAHRRR